MDGQGNRLEFMETKPTDIKVLEKLRIKKLLMGEIIKDSNQIFCSNQKTSLYKNHNRRKS